MPSFAAGDLEARLRELAGVFPQNPDLVRQLLAILSSPDRAGFRAAVLAALKQSGAGLYRKSLLTLLVREELFPVCDPAVLPLDEEIPLVQELAEMDPGLDVKLARRFSGLSAISDARAQHVLELLGAIPLGARVLPMLVKLLQHPNMRLRSKVVLLIGRATQSPQANDKLLEESDSRVRANAIEAFWSVDNERARAVLRKAAADANNRVAGNALLGLFRMGETESIPNLVQMSKHPQPLFRATAAWVMQQTGSPRFLPVLAQLVGEPDPRARTRIFRAIAALSRAAASRPPVRVHILGISGKPDGERVLRAAVASQSGAELQGLLPVALAVSEDGAPVLEYAVKKVPTPPHLSLAVVFPEGSAAEEILQELARLRRGGDRCTVARYPPGGALEAMRQAVASMELAPGTRHLLFLDDESTNGEEKPGWPAVILKARTFSVAIHAVGLSGAAFQRGSMLAGPTGGVSVGVDTLPQAGEACQKLCLSLLYAFEIRYRSAQGVAAARETKLEVHAPEGYGVDLLRTAAGTEFWTV